MICQLSICTFTVSLYLIRGCGNPPPRVPESALLRSVHKNCKPCGRDVCWEQTMSCYAGPVLVTNCLIGGASGGRTLRFHHDGAHHAAKMQAKLLEQQLSRLIWQQTRNFLVLPKHRFLLLTGLLSIRTSLRAQTAASPFCLPQQTRPNCA